MYHKKSMRIFLFTLCLLLISGALIIGAAQSKEHKKEAENKQLVQEIQEKQAPQTAADSDMPEVTASIQQSRTPEEPLQAAGQAVEYCYEIKIKDGYLDVFYYQTDRLFMHTGIPENMLSETQVKEVEAGKYFKDEQALYGYLESCTS